ncbi:hypothetical protein D3C86_1943390 [compost metagenome]
MARAATTDSRNQIGIDHGEEMADVGFTADFTFEMEDLGVGCKRVDHFFEIPCLEQPVHSVDEIDGTCSLIRINLARSNHFRKETHHHLLNRTTSTDIAQSE